MSASPEVVTTRAALAARIDLSQPRAVVMTMGALHEGHLTLVRRARELAAQVIVTVFVNPLQFGQGEDFDAYPRDLRADLAALAGEGASLVFAPSAAEMYPGEAPGITIDAGPLGRIWEGAIRPGHFSGVLTVVAKLASLTRADVALFGQKDAQQLALVRRMVADLNLPVAIEAVPIVREESGLAMSSRNAYLSQAERSQALALARAMTAGRDAAGEGHGPQAIFAAALGQLQDAEGVGLEYLALVDPQTLAPLAGPAGTGAGRAGEPSPGCVVLGAGVAAGTAPAPLAPGQLPDGRRALLMTAARVGPARLIDNVPLQLR